MGFSQALSGLNASSSNLNVIGNNIANSQTVGFKSSNAVFADVFAGAKIGAGVGVSNVQQNFSAGNVEGTGRALDLAISGEGFFKLNQGGQVVYSRNGQLTLTPAGFLENAQGARLMSGEGVIQVPSAAMPASATQQVKSVYNLKADSPVPSASKPFDPKDSTTFNYASTASVYDSLGSVHQLTTYFRRVGDLADRTWEVHATLDGKSITPTPAPVVAFDNQGVLQGVAPKRTDVALDAVDVTVGLDENARKNVYGAFLAGGPEPNDSNEKAAYNEYNDAFDSLMSSAPRIGSVRLEDAGSSLDEDARKNVYNAFLAGGPEPTDPGEKAAYNEYKAKADSLPFAYRPASFFVSSLELGNGAQDLSFDFNIDGTTQFGNDFDQSALTQDGYTAGSLVGITIDKNGTIVGNYSNEQKQTVGSLILATFRTPEGLQAVGNNVWIETAASGQPLFGTAGVGRFGSVESGALEVSNVDMTKELVNLIIAQRTFQANAQSVKAQSDLLEQAVNLR